MREFGIRFSAGLRKGLRAFPTSSPGNEMLIECFNLQPGENGLVARDDIEIIDHELNYTYFCLQSEVGDVWCIYIDYAGQIVTSFGPPAPIDGFTPENTSLDELPRYVQMPAMNEPDLQLYMYPDITGSLTVDYALPGGEGYEVDYIPFVSPNGYRYNLVVVNTLETLARQVT
jgi:hypothetical protein